MSDPMGGHKCRKIAQAKVMDEGRELWLGELAEPIPGHPQEKWCLHITTPYKAVVFGLNLGDMMAFAVFAHIAHEGPINHNWLDTMADLYKREAKTNV